MKNIRLEISKNDSDVAYLYLPAHLGKGVYGAVSKQVRLLELLTCYKGPDIYLDFNEEGVLVGIEVLA
jgi:uncharacterized protein YuzE